MRDASRVRMSHDSSVSMSHSSRVAGFLSSLEAAAALSFSDDGNCKELRYPGQECQQFTGEWLAKRMAQLETPVAGFADGSEGILIKARAVSDSASRVGLGIGRANGSQRPPKLVHQVREARISGQSIEILAAAITDKERQSIRGRLPERVGGDFPRNGHLPLQELLIQRHAEVLGRASPTAPSNSLA